MQRSGAIYSGCGDKIEKAAQLLIKFVRTHLREISLRLLEWPHVWFSREFIEMSHQRAPIAEATFTDRRSVPRKTVAIPAKVGFRNTPPVHCIVRNVSPMGALLEFSDDLDVPNNFRIIIESELFTADCEVRHNKDRKVGVLFTSNRLEAMARFG